MAVSTDTDPVLRGDGSCKAVLLEAALPLADVSDKGQRDVKPNAAMQLSPHLIASLRSFLKAIISPIGAGIPKKGSKRGVQHYGQSSLKSSPVAGTVA
jgi:hypothetical protein